MHMKGLRLRSVALVAVLLLGSATGSPTLAAASRGPVPAPTSSASPRATKIRVVVEENHSLDEMPTQMPYTSGLATRFGYADHYRAVNHPSLPNYLAIAGGSTFGVADDNPPSAHHVPTESVFGKAIAAGATARVYAEDMRGACRTSNDGTYPVRHDPWTYFTAPSERRGCSMADLPASDLSADVRQGRLPTVGMVVPNTCHDAMTPTAAHSPAPMLGSAP